jgi:hypothetical protein
MPLHAHRTTVETALSTETRSVLTLLLDQLNVLRAHVGLPVLTRQDLHAAALEAVRTHLKREV